MKIRESYKPGFARLPGEFIRLPDGFIRLPAGFIRLLPGEDVQLKWMATVESQGRIGKCMCIMETIIYCSTILLKYMYIFSRGSHLPPPHTAHHINVPLSGISCLHLYDHWRNPVNSGPLLYPT